MHHYHKSILGVRTDELIWYITELAQLQEADPHLHDQLCAQLPKTINNFYKQLDGQRKARFRYLSKQEERELASAIDTDLNRVVRHFQEPSSRAAQLFQKNSIQYSLATRIASHMNSHCLAVCEGRSIAFTQAAESMERVVSFNEAFARRDKWGVAKKSALVLAAIGLFVVSNIAGLIGLTGAVMALSNIKKSVSTTWNLRQLNKHHRQFTVLKNTKLPEFFSSQQQGEVKQDAKVEAQQTPPVANLQTLIGQVGAYIAMHLHSERLHRKASYWKVGAGIALGAVGAALYLTYAVNLWWGFALAGALLIGAVCNHIAKGLTKRALMLSVTPVIKYYAIGRVRHALGRGPFKTLVGSPSLTIKRLHKGIAGLTEQQGVELLGHLKREGVVDSKGMMTGYLQSGHLPVMPDSIDTDGHMRAATREFLHSFYAKHYIHRHTDYGMHLLRDQLHRTRLTLEGTQDAEKQAELRKEMAILESVLAIRAAPSLTQMIAKANVLRDEFQPSKVVVDLEELLRLQLAGMANPNIVSPQPKRSPSQASSTSRSATPSPQSPTRSMLSFLGRRSMRPNSSLFTDIRHSPSPGEDIMATPTNNRAMVESKSAALYHASSSDSHASDSSIEDQKRPTRPNIPKRACPVAAGLSSHHRRPVRQREGHRARIVSRREALVRAMGPYKQRGKAKLPGQVGYRRGATSSD